MEHANPDKVILLDIHLSISIGNKKKIQNQTLLLPGIPLYYYQDKSMILDLYFFYCFKGESGMSLTNLLEHWIKNIFNRLSRIRKSSGKEKNILTKFANLFPLVNKHNNPKVIKKFQNDEILKNINFSPARMAINRKRFLGRYSDDYSYHLLEPIQMIYFFKKNQKYSYSGEKNFQETWKAYYEAKILWTNN